MNSKNGKRSSAGHVPGFNPVIPSETWRERNVYDPGLDRRKYTTFQCPKCETRRHNRRDSFVPGLHTLTCPRCGFTSRTMHALDDTVHQ
jgi:predicted RNA-binding Zn-ribbon protein involved in translation (DUF1610 family)